jgi:hypothetical protein
MVLVLKKFKRASLQVVKNNMLRNYGTFEDIVATTISTYEDFKAYLLE